MRMLYFICTLFFATSVFAGNNQPSGYQKQTIPKWIVTAKQLYNQEHKNSFDPVKFGQSCSENSKIFEGSRSASDKFEKLCEKIDSLNYSRIEEPKAKDLWDQSGSVGEGIVTICCFPVIHYNYEQSNNGQYYAYKEYGNEVRKTLEEQYNQIK